MQFITSILVLLLRMKLLGVEAKKDVLCILQVKYKVDTILLLLLPVCAAHLNKIPEKSLLTILHHGGFGTRAQSHCRLLGDCRAP